MKHVEGVLETPVVLAKAVVAKGAEESSDGNEVLLALEEVEDEVFHRLAAVGSDGVQLRWLPGREGILPARKGFEGDVLRESFRVAIVQGSVHPDVHRLPVKEKI